MKQICRRVTVCGAAGIDNGNNSPSPWYCCAQPCPSWPYSRQGKGLVFPQVTLSLLLLCSRKMFDVACPTCHSLRSICWGAGWGWRWTGISQKGPSLLYETVRSGAVSCARLKEASLVAVTHFSHYPVLLKSRLLLARKCYLDLSSPLLWKHVGVLMNYCLLISSLHTIFLDRLPAGRAFVKLLW